MKKLKRAELIIVALTIAFAAFTGGYFAGRRGSVNIVTVYPEARIPAAVVHAQTAELARIEPPSPALELPYGADDEMYYAHTGESLSDPDSQDAEPDEYPGDAEPPEDGEEPDAGAPRSGSHRIININTASLRELTDLHGIGDALAGRIVDYRNRHGGFSRIEDIMNVSGIGPARFDAIRDRITVG